uniref:Ig-like domain-containing protein n=1 Tax=Eptatretus burgeri TaxID=7764 RepID=A0A8C4N5Y2_EPTBU
MSEQAPTFIKPLQSVVALEGGATAFEAQISGSPVPEVSWFKDGQAISSAPGIEISFSQGRSRLAISQLTTAHSGKYSVRANNAFGHATSTAELLITAQTSPPNFTQRLQSMSVPHGREVRLEVRLMGIPTPIVKFYREGAEIQSSADFQICHDDNLYSLIIAKAHPEDSGTFSVTATNSVGRATSTAQLIVQGDEHGELIPMKKTKTISSSLQTKQTRIEKKVEQYYETQRRAEEVAMAAGVITRELRHKTPPRIPPRLGMVSPPPPTTVQQRPHSLSPIRHVRGPTPSPVRSVSPAGRGILPIRSVKSPILTRKTQVQLTKITEKKPPWKQEDYAAIRVAEMRAAELQAAEMHAEELRIAEARAAEQRALEALAKQKREAELHAAESLAAEAEKRAAAKHAAEARKVEMHAIEKQEAEIVASVKHAAEVRSREMLEEEAHAAAERQRMTETRTMVQMVTQQTKVTDMHVQTRAQKQAIAGAVSHKEGVTHKRAEAVATVVAALGQVMGADEVSATPQMLSGAEHVFTAASAATTETGRVEMVVTPPKTVSMIAQPQTKEYKMVETMVGIEKRAEVKGATHFVVPKIAVPKLELTEEVTTLVWISHGFFAEGVCTDYSTHQSDSIS